MSPPLSTRNFLDVVKPETQSPSSPPVFTLHRILEDAADPVELTDRGIGMNFSNFNSGIARVIPSAGATPEIEVVFWSEEKGKFISAASPLTVNSELGKAFDYHFPSLGRFLAIKVNGGIPAGQSVTILLAGTREPLVCAASDVLLPFSLGNYTNGNDDRYFWDPINKKLYGPFSANQIAWGTIGGRKYANHFEAVVETTGHTEDFTAWTTIGSASVTSDQITAPDSAKLADKLTFTASPTDGIKIALGSATDNTDQTEAVFVCTLSGTKGFRLQFLLKDGTTATSGNLTATTQWQRLDFTADILSGGTTPEIRIINDSGGTAGDIYIWGSSVYKDRSFPYAYRTNETGADQSQAKDQFYWPSAVVPSAMRDGKYKFNICPYYANGECGSFYAFDFYDSASGKRIYMYISGANSFEIWDDTPTRLIDGGALTWSRYQLPTLTVDAVDGTLKIVGATTGDGTFEGTPWKGYLPASSTLTWGARYDFTSWTFFNGLISEPFG